MTAAFALIVFTIAGIGIAIGLVARWRDARIEQAEFVGENVTAEDFQ